MTLHKNGRLRSSAATRVQQLGFTLIELLISMALGIVIIGALVVMYTSGSAATRNAQAQGQMNEDAQMALAVITHELRQAGYNPTRAGGAVNDLLQGGWGLFACETGFTNNATPNVSALLCNAAGSSTSLAVVYEGDLYSGKNTAANLPMDCIGNGVAPTVAGGTYYTMQSRLYIANNALNCNGGGNLNQSQVLAENIESMSVSFAVVEPTVANSQRVLGYVSAADLIVPGNADLAALPALQRWNKVVAAQVCLVVRSENPVLGEMSNSTYQDCSNAIIAIADGRLRRAYRTTVLMRNHGVGYVSN